MNYSALIGAVKELVMKMPAPRLLLVWSLVITCILAWKAADILQAIAVLAK